jgi:hypothetical protein
MYKKVHARRKGAGAEKVEVSATFFTPPIVPLRYLRGVPEELPSSATIPGQRTPGLHRRRAKKGSPVFAPLGLRKTRTPKSSNAFRGRPRRRAERSPGARVTFATLRGMHIDSAQQHRQLRGIQFQASFRAILGGQLEGTDFQTFVP